MFDKNLAIVDIETTGMSASHNRIIEIAIIRVEGNKIVDKFTTLVNPQTHVSPFIVDLTGIRVEDLKQAPVFEEVASRIVPLLQDAVFVAHNVRFDYSFIKTELKRTGIPFRSKTCCTVRLSRRLFPQHRSHSLESIIERHNFSYKRRHRAYDDAHILWQFLKEIKKTLPKKKVTDAWAAITKSLYSADPHIRTRVDDLPEGPGVYMFYDRKGELLYVGKSNNISERVVSHFSEDILSAKHLQLMKEIADINYIETAGELGALLTESRLVKKLNPVYNRRLREKQMVYVLKKSKNNKGYSTLKTEMQNIRDIDTDNVFRTFNSKSGLKAFLTDFCDKYKLCPKLLSLETGKGPCFAHKLGKCKGACIGRENKTLYNGRFLIACVQEEQFKKWPFDGVIEITEENKEEEIWERFRFDNWSLVERENHRGETEQFEPFFDIDTYFILSRYFKKNKGHNLKNA